MTEAKRYDLDEVYHGCYQMAESEAGEYVLAEDFDREVASLREECERLRGRLEKAWLEGDRLAMLGYKLQQTTAERDTMRQQLAEMTKDRDDCLSARKHYVEKVGDALAQNYTLAGLLAKAQEELDPHRHAVLWGEICAALAEVKPCPESPHPAAT